MKRAPPVTPPEAAARRSPHRRIPAERLGYETDEDEDVSSVQSSPSTSSPAVAPPVTMISEDSSSSSSSSKEEQSEQTANTNKPPAIAKGLAIREKFDDGLYYRGRVVAAEPEEVIDEDSRNLVMAWQVKYEDGVVGHRTKEEIYKWLDDQQAHKPEKLNAIHASTSSSYQQTREDLCYRMGVTEEQVVAALDQMKPPYGLNAAMRLIHEAQRAPVDPQEFIEETGKFEPQVGTRLRKLVDGCTYYGTITADETWNILPESGEQVKMWEVTWDGPDGTKDDLDFQELLECRASRPTRTHPIRGRQLFSLELFSGCGVVTQHFAERKWRVRSIDNSPTSYATDTVDIMGLTFADIGMIPDFIWASPPCFTYSNMAGGKHRDAVNFEKTPEARENNRFFARMAYIMRMTLQKKPHAIIVIENPVGLMSKMPLMEQLEKDLNLRSTIVHYCAFGRDDKKPTRLWTNDFQLWGTLSSFKCGRHTCPYFDGDHPIGVRRHAARYNAAAIPESLADEVADHVHSTFYQRRIRHTPEVVLTKEEEEEFDRFMKDP